MSECDILKLKKMYGCDTDECDDHYKTSECEIYKAKGKCYSTIVKKNCKKTCDQCNVIGCKEPAVINDNGLLASIGFPSLLPNTKWNVEPKC